MEIVTFADRRDLDIQPPALSASWPRFMLKDPIAFLYYEFLDEWSEHVLLGLIDSRAVVRARLGAETLSVCPTSMTITGTIDEWADWTGSRFEHSGDIAVPGALVPVHVDLEHDHAVYVEPNVWMRHSW